MMFYSNKTYNKISLDLKKSIFVVVLLLLVSFLVLGIAIVFVNDKNIVLLMIITTLFMTLSGWISLVLYYNIILKGRTYLRFLNKIMNSSDEIIKGKIKDIKYNITSSDGIECNEIYLIKDNKEFIIKVDTCLTDCTLSIGDEIVAHCRQNYLFGYEDANYEK